MFLIFNKQFRAEEKFFNEIAKKIKATKQCLVTPQNT